MSEGPRDSCVWQVDTDMQVGSWELCEDECVDKSQVSIGVYTDNKSMSKVCSHAFSINHFTLVPVACARACLSMSPAGLPAALPRGDDVDLTCTAMPTTRGPRGE